MEIMNHAGIVFLPQDVLYSLSCSGNEAPVFSYSFLQSITATLSQAASYSLAVISSEAVTIAAYVNGTIASSASGVTVTVSSAGSSGDIKNYTASVTLTTIYPAYISFRASTSSGLMGIISPVTFLCACSNGVTCSSTAIEAVPGDSHATQFSLYPCNCPEGK